MSKKPQPQNDGEITLIKVKTPKFRVSFPNLFEPKAMDEKSAPKFGVTMLFPKSEDDENILAELEKSYDAAIAKGLQDKWNGKLPKNLRSPFRDGDEEEDYCDRDGYPGHIFVRATSTEDNPPGVVHVQRDPATGKRRVIDDPAEVYAGCYAVATVVAYPYSVGNNKGVAFGLQNIMKVEDGESFSGRKAAADDFDDDEWHEYEDSDDDWEDEE